MQSLKSPLASWRQAGTSISRTVLGAVAEQPADRVLLRDLQTGRTTTAASFVEQVGGTMAALRGLGVQPGHVVGYQAANSLDFPVVLHAIVALGAVACPLSPDLAEHDTSSQLRRCRADLHLYSDVSRTNAASPWRLHAVEALRAAVSPLSPLPLLDSDDHDVWQREALRPFSSGTSGRPHGVRLSHGNLLSNLGQVSSAEQLRADDVLLGVVPFWHSYGLCMVMNAALHAGCTVLVSPAFNMQQTLRAMRELGVTRAHLAPPILHAMLRHAALVRQAGPFPALTDLFSGGARLSAAAELRLRELFGPAVHVRQGYGLTEASPATHMLPHGWRGPAGTVGVLLPDTEARLVCPHTGADLSATPGASGELRVRGPQVMLGYVDGRVDDAFDELGFLRTGDLASCDERGFFFINDRLKDVIKHRGHAVAPSELEALLADHPAVLECAVVGVPFADDDDEQIVAFVVPHEQPGPTLAAQLIDLVAERCAPWKRIRRVQFVDQLPRNGTGKVLKYLLKKSMQGKNGPLE